MTSTKTGGITTYNYSVGGGSGGITTGSPAPITEMLGDKGVVAADRRIIIDGLTEVRPLTEARQRQFDELLAENGKDITPFTGSSLTSSRVAANVSDSGRFPTAAGGSDGPDYFVLGQGRVEVTDDHAVFFPADGGAAIRTVAEAVPEGNDSATAASTAKSNALPPAQIRSALRRVKQLGGRLNKSQTQALTQTLQNPGEQFIIATTDGSDPATEISAASTFADGSVFIQTLHNGMTSTITFDPTGSVTSSMSNTYSSATSGMPQFSLLTALLAMIGSILNLVLGVYLLICGILILRQSGKGALLHWIYVAIKLPLGIATAFAMASLWSQLFKSIPSGAGPRTTWMSVAAATPSVLGLIYPAALFFVLRSVTVRSYYNAAR